MPAFPGYTPIDPLVISAGVLASLGAAFNASGFALGETTVQASNANAATYVPFKIVGQVTFQTIFVINGATLAGSLDMGIYDAGGVRLFSVGGTVQSGTSLTQEVPISPPLTLGPGLYYLAFVATTGSATYQYWTPTISLLPGLGVFQQANAYPLPSNATFGGILVSRVPSVGISQRSSI